MDSSFHNYYFVIEGLYADGKYSEKEVLKKFVASDELATACSRALSSIRNFHWRDIEVLEAVAAQLSCDLSIPSVYRMLWLIRGRVHHFQAPTRPSRWAPSTQGEFEVIARFAQAVATNGLILRETVLNGTPDRVWWKPVIRPETMQQMSRMGAGSAQAKP